MGHYELVRIEYRRESGSGQSARYTLYEVRYGVGTNNELGRTVLDKGLTLKQAKEAADQIRNEKPDPGVDPDTDFFVDMKPDKKPTIWDLWKDKTKLKP
jgi:hypothetical protein